MSQNSDVSRCRGTKWAAVEPSSVKIPTNVKILQMWKYFSLKCENFLQMWNISLKCEKNTKIINDKCENPIFPQMWKFVFPTNVKTTDQAQNGHPVQAELLQSDKDVWRRTKNQRSYLFRMILTIRNG